MGCNCEVCHCGGDATGLAHIGIMVRDIQESVKFYETVLGFEYYYNAEVPGDSGATKLAFLRNGSCEIELVEPPAGEERKDGVIDHIALSVKGIDTMMARLEAAGVDFDTEKPAELPALFKNGSKSVFFRGPDGERLEFFEQL